jgi:hypothetical protein
MLCIGGQFAVHGQGGKPRTFTPVSLSVEVANTSAQRIKGDEGLFYEDGAPDGTTANIDKYGNLIISFGRSITLEYGTPLDPGEPISGDYDNSYISTLNAGGKALQSLDDGESQCIKLNWQYDIPGGWLRHGFNRVEDPSVQDDTSFAVVTRADLNTWMVEPVEPAAGFCGVDGNPDSVARVFSQVQVSSKGKRVVTEATDYGKYSLPFKLTLTRKQ